jgi:hypothetical protein
MKYEQDFIYNIIPNLTHAIKDLTKELKRYNDNFECKNYANGTEAESFRQWVDSHREENDGK